MVTASAVVWSFLLLTALVQGSTTKAVSSASGGFLSGTPSDTCIVDVTGDVNVDGVITSSDIIGIVRYVFLQGPPPQPCVASGDTNCSGIVSSSDVIVLVNYVFKGAAPLCDVCSIWSLWAFHCN